MLVGRVSGHSALSITRSRAERIESLVFAGNCHAGLHTYIGSLQSGAAQVLREHIQDNQAANTDNHGELQGFSVLCCWTGLNQTAKV